MPNPIFALQSLRLSSGNEQNLCNLAHCRVLWCRLSPPSRKRQRGVKVGLMNERIGKSATTTEHLRSSRYWGCRVPHAKHSPRLSVRFTTTGASPTLPIYIVPSAQCRCSFAPICLTRLPGRTEARPYDRMVFSAIYYVENK